MTPPQLWNVGALTPWGFWQGLALHSALGLVLKDSGGIAARGNEGDGK